MTTLIRQIMPANGWSALFVEPDHAQPGGFAINISPLVCWALLHETNHIGQVSTVVQGFDADRSGLSVEEVSNFLAYLPPGGDAADYQRPAADLWARLQREGGA